MTTSDLVRKLCKEQDISLAELARRTGQSRQNLNKKLANNTLSTDELNRIAVATGAVFEQAFVLPDGERIGIEGSRSGGINT